jgi:Protein of unknown function (DUF4231)
VSEDRPTTDESLFDDNPDRRQRAAAQRLERQLAWYEKHAARNRVMYQVFQTATIVLGGLTPILVLWTSLPKTIQALPAALASVAAGLSGVFGWRDDWVRFAHTAEALKSERIYFQTRTGERYRRELDDDDVLENLVAAIEQLATSEVSEWSASYRAPARVGRDAASEPTRPVGDGRASAPGSRKPT